MTELAPRTPIQELVSQIRGDQFRAEIANALPGNILPDRFVRVTVTAINQNPALVTVNRSSLFAAVIRCAQDGLLPDAREAVIVDIRDSHVKEGKAAAYWPMIGGYRKIAADNGITLNAFVVYENDEFDYVLGEAPHVHHKPPRLGEDRGEPIGAYSVATYANGRMVCPPEVMDVNEIEKVRAVSRAATNEYGPWVNWWDQQARKTVARRLFKQLPLRDLDERQKAILEAADDEAEFPAESTQTVDEANIDASIGAPVHPSGGGPDDSVDGEVIEEPDYDDEWSESAEDEPLPDEPAEGEQQTAFPIPSGPRGGRRS
jgi:recombination protein RecT